MPRIEDSTSAPRERDHAAGRLSTGWQMMLTVTWVAVFFAFSSVWKASEELGIGTWWLGPRANPQPTIVRIIPFAIAVVVVVAAMYNVRRLSLLSTAAAIGIAAIAAFDISRSGGLAAIEFAVAGAALLVSLASLTGQQPALPFAARRPAGLKRGDPLPPPTRVSGDTLPPPSGPAA